jgi:focal adhesion kinase 2
VKICDFGLSHTAQEDEYDASASDFKFPIRWSAPEVIQSGRFSTASDVWSFAVSVWEMMEGGKKPYYELATNQDVIERVCDDGYRLKRPKSGSFDCPDAFWALLERCWAGKASKRPTFGEIVEALEELVGDDDDDDVDGGQESFARTSYSRPTALADYAKTPSLDNLPAGQYHNTQPQDDNYNTRITASSSESDMYNN